MQIKVKESFQNETLFHISRRLHEMRVESLFFEESSAHLILTRARGLGILTFGKIRKKVKWMIFQQTISDIAKIICILSKPNTPQKNDVKKFFMEVIDCM